MALIIDSISFAYNDARLFQNFSLRLSHGVITAILGPSGCGKTTFLKLIAGLLIPSTGSVLLTDGDGSMAPISNRRVSFIFQEPRLLPWRTILENVAIPMEAIVGHQQAMDRGRAFLDSVGLGKLETSYPDTLSGGQRQRASIARAFCYPAPLVLMDEPFQSLDLPLRIQLMDLTLALLEKEKRIAIAVTHDPREAIYLANRVVVISGAPVRAILDEKIELAKNERAYSSTAAASLEARLFEALST